MTEKTYKVVISKRAIRDISSMKKYILEQFKYTQLGISFSSKIRKALESLEVFPFGNISSGLKYREYDIFIKTSRTYMIFYIIDIEKQFVLIVRVLQESMNWKAIISSWLIDTNN